MGAVHFSGIGNRRLCLCAPRDGVIGEEGAAFWEAGTRPGRASSGAGDRVTVPEQGVVEAAQGRVVHVGPSADARGGIASVIRLLLNDLPAQGWEAELVPTISERGALVSAANTLAMRSRLAEALVADRSAVCHVHVASRGSFMRKSVALRIARKLGNPTVLHLHGGRFDAFYEDLPTPLRRRVVETFRAADAVITLSPEWQAVVQRLFDRDSVVVPNPVRVPVRRVAEPDQPMVLFLGKLGQQKGTPELLNAIALLQLDGVRARFVLAGNGDLDDARRCVASLPLPDLVDVPGWLSPEDVSQRVADAWVFCLPSHQEGKPVALLEAMAGGVVPVVTPVGGMPDVVEEGRNGLIVPVGNPAALATAVKRLLDDAELRRSLSEAARTSVIGVYSVEQTCACLAEVYAMLVRASASGIPA